MFFEHLLWARSAFPELDFHYSVFVCLSPSLVRNVAHFWSPNVVPTPWHTARVQLLFLETEKQTQGEDKKVQKHLWRKTLGLEREIKQCPDEVDGKAGSCNDTGKVCSIRCWCFPTINWLLWKERTHIKKMSLSPKSVPWTDVKDVPGSSAGALHRKLLEGYWEM